MPRTPTGNRANYVFLIPYVITVELYLFIFLVLVMVLGIEPKSILPLPQSSSLLKIYYEIASQGRLAQAGLEFEILSLFE